MKKHILISSTKDEIKGFVVSTTCRNEQLHYLNYNRWQSSLYILLTCQRTVYTPDFPLLYFAYYDLVCSHSVAKGSKYNVNLKQSNLVSQLYRHYTAQCFNYK